ncbi:anthranilate phosphoribosyltransferase [Luedemannella helvata]|uniref:Anthranilate phosphoribosyltransferase n=1 Tax=Luedemannella helvata TaxID=349315 RepID=A0ABN2JXL2_9ACTN
MTHTWPALLADLLAGHDLTAEAAAWAMGDVVNGDATPARLGAFLAALRAKGETAAEVDGLVTALLGSAAPIVVPGPTLDIVGTGGDGTNAVNISTMAAIVVAATGTTVVKHGGRAASSTTAGAADVVERLGVPLSVPAGAHAAIAAAAGITFIFAGAAHPGMSRAAPIRRDLGVPTVFNVLGPLINPARPAHRLIGVADPRLLPVVAEVLRRRGASALVVRGDDGLDKLTTTTTSRVWVVRDFTATEHVLDPREQGIPRPADGALRGGDADANAAVVHALLAGERGPVRDAVLLNAAAATLAATPAAAAPLDSLDKALVRCAEAIDSGAAATTLATWRDAAQTYHRS